MGTEGSFRRESDIVFFHFFIQKCSVYPKQFCGLCLVIASPGKGLVDGFYLGLALGIFKCGLCSFLSEGRLPTRYSIN